MPLLVPEAPATAPARPGRLLRARARAAAARADGAPILCLALSSSLEAGHATWLADAILRRVLGCGRPVGTVVLDLRPDSAVDADDCAALLSLHERLASIGTRLRVAATCHGLGDRLREAGVSHRLGPDAVHPSFRSAVLATYAEQAGPGLVTGRVRAALEMQAEALQP